MALDAHLVSHTHWDREWYHAAERFRQRLVGLVDELIDDPPRGDESFLLDGQAIVIEDYLSVRPERAAELSTLLARGALEAGPWYVLADELIPSGEALVRNLLAGRRVLEQHGAHDPGVLYCPDSFGHPAALPSIATGFGLPLIVLWRGYGGRRWPAGDTARWTAPSGESAVVYHLPPDGYEFGSHLPVDAARAAERWAKMRGELAPRAATGTVLVTHGADHHARQVGFRDAIAALETAVDAAGNGDRLRASSLERFARRVVERSGDPDVALPDIRGELRDSYGYTWCLQGTFASRAHEKRLNARTERLLTREMEPWTALAPAAGGDTTRAANAALRDAAWCTLLRAHPHDTLCGCAIDDVARAMELRLHSAAVQATGLRDDAILRLLGHDLVAARDARDRWTPISVVRNPVARPRSGVAIVDVEQWLADIPVGPGSALAAVAPPPPGGPASRGFAPRLGGLGAVQVLSTAPEYSLTESPRHYPDNDLVSVTRAAVWIDDVPAYGLTSHPIGGRKSARSLPCDPVVAERGRLRNGVLALTVDDGGVVSLEHLASGRRVASLVDLTDEFDAGDLYTPSPRARSVRVDFRGARLVHRGPLRGELALRYRVVDAAARRTIADVDVHLVLDAGAQFVRLAISGENLGHDHRLRIAVHTDVADGKTWCDAAFGPVRREPIVVDAEEAAVETPPLTGPLHRYVSRFTADRGATLVSDGLAEYESCDDGTLMVTLVRAVGGLSRGDIPERPGHAGWPRLTPAAQCRGPFAAELAVLLHGPRSARTIDDIERAADDVLCPITGFTLRSALVVPPPVTGPELIGTGLAVSAIKPSEDGQWMVLRCVNFTEHDVDGEWRLPFDVTEARLSRLDETLLGDAPFEGRVLPLHLTSRAIHTLLVR